ncbi:hypothetical protein GCM10011320_58840 [Neoroseomonas lacus]|uniref:Uncharacterized protein n=1 Tax=Neoroseomonas lacus TaxID=287609 RepID=A0A917NZG7_9PROT|nr:hypothetical protein GCM10011320_58840 [Neoroseomonas lacus]
MDPIAPVSAEEEFTRRERSWSIRAFTWLCSASDPVLDYPAAGRVIRSQCARIPGGHPVSRPGIAQRSCACSMDASDVTGTLKMALAASGDDQERVCHRPSNATAGAMHPDPPVAMAHQAARDARK